MDCDIALGFCLKILMNKEPEEEIIVFPGYIAVSAATI